MVRGGSGRVGVVREWEDGCGEWQLVKMGGVWGVR